MSLTKYNDLQFEYEFPSSESGVNDSHEVNITKEGIEIGHDTLSWADIKKAHDILFKENGEL